MGRKPKQGIDYISMDCDHTTSKKIKQLFIDCNSDGYWIWQCILADAGESTGYYFDISNKDDIEFFAVETCKKDIDIFMKVVERAIYRGLFNKAIADEYKVLTSVRMQENYIVATSDRRRKGSKVSFYRDYLLIDIEHGKDNFLIIQGNCTNSSGNKLIVPGNNNKKPDKNTHSIVIVEDKDSIEKGELEEANASSGKTDVLRQEQEERELKKQWDALKKTGSSVHAFIETHKPRFIEPYVELWNIWAFKHGRTKVKDITASRKKHFKARINQKSFDFIEILKAAQEQSFLMKGNWFTFNWIIESPDNYVKVLEGQYKEQENEPPKAINSTQQPHPQANAMIDMLEEQMRIKTNPNS